MCFVTATYIWASGTENPNLPVYGYVEDKLRALA